MTEAEVAGVLRSVALFGTFDEGELKRLAERGEVARFGPGERIAAEGERPDAFCVVLEGETEWTRKGAGGEEVHLVTLGEGSVFAELHLVLDEPFPTTGRAATGVRLFKLGVDAFWELLSAHPEILRGIVATSAERARLHESVVQQHARLVSLATVAAGFAHELNNPAAAAARSAEEAVGALRSASSAAIKLVGSPLGPEERAFLAGLPEEVAKRSSEAPALDPLQRSDLEDEVAAWLEGRGVEGAWDLSPALVGAGLDVGWLEELARRVPEAAAGEVVRWLGEEAAAEGLLREVRESSSRVSELVGAIKSYSHVDGAPLEEADLREGIESALVSLGHRLGEGQVSVERDYDENLPRVPARPAELNQVWTSLLENALDAVGGEGKIRVRTFRDGDAATVEVIDDGPGIPSEARDRVFEPFFTTKDVGEGTGLGLYVARRIVEGGHGGTVRFYSGPGETKFAVRLPAGGEGPCP